MGFGISTHLSLRLLQSPVVVGGTLALEHSIIGSRDTGIGT